MRIALIAHADAPWTPHYAHAFQERGHEVLLISFHPEQVPRIRQVFVGIHGDPPLRGKSMYVTHALRVRSILRIFAADLVFAPYIISNGLAAVLSFSGPVVVSVRGGDLMEHVGRRPAPYWLHRVLIRFICRRARLIHTVADELTDVLVSFGVDRSRVVTFPTGVDLHLFAPREGPVGWRDVPRLVCTRRHERVYHNDIVVEALARLRERGVPFELSFVGGGTLLDERRSHVTGLQLDDSIRFTGQIPHHELPGLLRAMDIYISASSADGTSSSLLEALACGVFPVVSDIRANRDWIRDGVTGYLFATNSPDDLAAKLGKAIEARDRWAAASAANRRLVEERADMTRNMERLLNLLESVARGSIPSFHGREL